MHAFRRLIAALAIGCGAAASGVAGEFHLVPDPGDPGPNRPPVGRSLFDELYREADGSHRLPYPFETLLIDLEARAAPAEITAALIPLGRSLQRHASFPDYFTAPRVVVAMTGDPGRPGRPFLQDRLYLGYHEEAGVMEVISWNETAGRFEFQVVENYRAGSEPLVENGERSVCAACHQSGTPIFPTALWSETNANPAVAERLAPLGDRYHGVAVRAPVDAPDAIDRSTDRAHRLPFTSWLWQTGCGEGRSGTLCRRVLLEQALTYRLRGNRPARQASAEVAQVAAQLHTRLSALAPSGIAGTSPDLPNRDPLREIMAGADPYEAVEPDGMFEPSAPRTPVVFWTPETQPPELVDVAVRDIALAFSDDDIVRLDHRLVALGALAPDRRIEIACVTSDAIRPGGTRELGFECARSGDDGRLTAAGFIQTEGDRVIGGRVQTLDLGADGQAPRSRVTGGRWLGDRLVLEIAEGGLGLAPRLSGGRRLASFTIVPGADGRGRAAAELAPDLLPLQTALDRMTGAAAVEPQAALAFAPLRRRAILAELAAALEPAEARP